MANALGPYYVRVNYHSVFAPHTMTIPTRTWNPDGGFGTFEAWDSSAPAADAMIEALIDLFQPLYNTDTVFDNWVIYKQLLPTDDPQPVMSGSILTWVGSNSGASWAKAVESILTARTAGFGIAKLDFLDVCSEDNYDPVTTLVGAYAAVFAEWSDPTNAWSSRDNTKPATALKLTTNLHQKLRKQYHMD